MSVQTEIIRISTAKSDIKNTVNTMFANTIANEKIDAYPPLINNSIAAYKGLIPWRKGVGTNFTIEDTHSDYLQDFKMYGNIEQNIYSGTNLISWNNISSTTSNGITYSVQNNVFTLNGTASDNIRYIYNNNWTLKNAGNYTLKIEALGGSWTAGIIGISSRNSSDTQVRYHQVAYNTSNLLTTKDYPSDQIEATSTIGFYINSGSKFSNFKFRIIFNEGSTASDYEPYVGGAASPNPDYPQNINTVNKTQNINIYRNQLIDFNNSSGITDNTTYNFQNDILTISSSNKSYAGINFVITNLYKSNSNKYLRLDFDSLDNSNYGGGSIAQLAISYNDGTPIKYMALISTNKSIINHLIPNNVSNISAVRLYIYSNNSSATTGDYSLILTKPILHFGQTKISYEQYCGSVSYPIDLKSKNLFDKNNANVLNAYISSSKVITTSDYDKTLYIPCKPNTTYTISKSLSSPANQNKFRVTTTHDLPTVNTTGIDYVGYDTGTEITNITITTSSNANYLCVFIINTNTSTTTLSEILDTIQIEQNSTATSYEPYYDYELCKINDYEDEISKSTGKNLCPTDLQDWEQGTISSGNNNSSTTRIRTKDYYPIKNDIDYHISVNDTNYRFLNIHLYNENKTFVVQYYTINTAINGATNLTINIPSSTYPNVKYMRIVLKTSAESTIVPSDVEKILPQIEKGTVKTEFEPYGEVWYKKKNINKITLNGTENWGLQNTYTNTLRFTSSILINGLDAEQLKIKCNKFVNGTTCWDNSDNEHIRSAGLGYPSAASLNINKTRLSSQDSTGLKSWLTTNPLTVYYILARPTYINITGPNLISQLEAIKTYTGINHFSVSNSNDTFPTIEVITEGENSYNNWRNSSLY